MKTNNLSDFGFLVVLLTGAAIFTAVVVIFVNNIK